MAWLTAAYVVNMIGSDQSDALGLTTTSGTVETSRFAQAELKARTVVLSALIHAGYPAVGPTLDVSTDAAAITSAFLQAMASSVMVRDVFALVPGIELTASAQASIGQGLTMIDAVYDKQLPIPGMDPTGIDAIGGSKFNVDGTTILRTTQPVFTALRGSGF